MTYSYFVNHHPNDNTVANRVVLDRLLLAKVTRTEVSLGCLSDSHPLRLSSFQLGSYTIQHRIGNHHSKMYPFIA